ncbi:alkyl hydroperoxide reductase family protein [Mycobacterium kansasii 732]|nr:alkyl hydroperoxide reductase family protein [Mycobacterium kansasii 732]
MPPAGSCGTAKERMDGHVAGVECNDWFFCTKELSADDVESAIRVDGPG